MMDEFAAKRTAVQGLLGALKQNAAEEMARTIGGDPKKKQVTHTPIPTESVAEHTHNKESYKPGAPERKDPKPSTSDLDTGEKPEATASPEMADKMTMESPKEEMEEPMMEEPEEDADSSAFSNLLKKRKK